MSTRQYIGARYVPKFADPIEHDSTRSYEALTIVTHLGTSYTSKKAVPANTTISNSEYWVATGNYNAQIEEYREEVEEYNDKIIDARKYRNIVLIGDSYGTANTGTTTVSVTFPQALQNYLGFTNDQFHASFQNGAGFGNGAFTTLLTNLIGSMTEKDSVTDVYFFGGWNDEANRVNNTQFLSGVSACETLIENNFPHAIKHAVFWSNDRRAYSSNLYIAKGWYKSLASRGWSVINNLDYLLINPANLGTDGAHPSQDGVYAFASAMVDAILNGEAHAKMHFQILLNTVTGATDVVTNFSAVSAVLYVDVDDATTTLDFHFASNNGVVRFNDGTADITKNIACNGSNLEVGSFPDHTIKGAANFCYVPVCGYILTSDGTRVDAQFNVVFQSDKLYIWLPYITNASWAAQTISNCKGILLSSGKSSILSDFV